MAGLQVSNEQPRLTAFTTDEGQPPTVRRRRRPRRAARSAGDANALARRHVVALDDEDFLVGVLGVFEDRAGRHVPTEVEAASVRGEGDLAQFLLVGCVRGLDQRRALTAVHVVHPDLAGPQATSGRAVLAGYDIATVRAPGCAADQEIVLLEGQLATVRSIDIHEPQVLGAAAVRGEDDPAAIRREARLMLDRHPLGDARGRPARHGHQVEIAQKVEQHGLAVRADVHVHPCALGHIDRDLLGRHCRRRDVPCDRISDGIGGRGRADHQQRQGKETLLHGEAPGQTYSDVVDGADGAHPERRPGFVRTSSVRRRNSSGRSCRRRSGRCSRRCIRSR
ncbi:hypothetical protein D3C80_833890 [compost metagenome]